VGGVIVGSVSPGPSADKQSVTGRTALPVPTTKVVLWSDAKPTPLDAAREALCLTGKVLSSAETAHFCSDGFRTETDPAFGSLKSNTDPKHQFSPNNNVPYCLYEAPTKPLPQVVEFSMLEMFRSRPLCGCVESFLL